MKIKIEKLDIKNNLQLKSIVKWDNDTDLYHLITPVKSKDSSVEVKTVEQLTEMYEQSPEYAKGIYIILDEDRPIGSFSLQFNPGHLLKNIPNTSWLGLTIGEKEYWGKGIANKAIKYFEEESRCLGANRIELGVFEFNERAQKFYQKQGYREIGRIPNFTYWNGKLWDDIRMEKYLE